MIQNASFQRKVVYLGLIALLLIPLYMIGHPATGDPTKLNSSPGGQLAQLRSEYDLAPTELGEIDPASESMKLATLGMKGIAANVLLMKANHYKKTEEWEKLIGAVNQLVKLQPHFVKVWEFQSHNVSYNVSVEFDDYKFRYAWVKKGIEFLTNGVRYNRHEPKMPWTVGWYTGQKIGRADEHKQFRRLFGDDKDFHLVLSQYVPIDAEGRGADQRPDSWLTSRLWYESAYDIVDTQQAPIRGKAPHIFYSDGPKALMNYANTIETEGVLDEKAQYAWRRAGENWHTYGNRIVPTSWGIRIRLNDEEAVRAEAERLSDELDKLVPGLRDKITQEKIAALSELE
ncbi:MAG: IRE (iron responsive element), partial [Planctomycetia bacterium]|nr:IRE (iron responsive element) [Planctomycetia bacterium]